MVQSIYYLVVAICFIASLIAYKYNRSFKVLPWLMGTSVIVEAMAAVLTFIYGINPFWLYHIYLLVYSGLMTYFFYHLISEPSIKKILVITFFIYIIISLYLTLFFYSLTDFPGLSMNLLGFLLISCSVYVIFTLEPVNNIPLYKHPVAWICIGIIVFYTGTFFLNGIYNYLILSKSKNRVIIHSIINNGLNCFMYLSFIMGLVCSHRLKKYTSPITK